MSAPSFIFGGNTGLSYEQLQKRRQVLEAMQARSSGQVARNTGEGIAQLGEALGRRLQGMALDREETAMEAEQAPWNATLADAQASMLSPSGGAYAAPAAGGNVASIAGGPSPSDPGIFNTFIDTAKAGGVSNPYALAAVAATGQAESGYDPKNAFGNWSDPSQSGQAGTAGGIMSWRADRLAGLQKFAAANGDDPNKPSPATQAKFFVQEDPALIQRLNAAGSVEEAQSLMNGAWKFAGYDQPGGEADRRLGLARGYLPRFQGGDGTQVASLDPSAGMGGTPAGDTPWLRYANQGATRSQPVSSNLAGALGFLPELGVTAEVFSGGQSSAEEGGPRTGSTRHDHGGAADVRFMRDGRKLDWSNPDDVPIFQEIVRRGKAAGLTGFGAGDGYMERGTMHVGFGNPGVWGAGGKGENAPDWLRQAYESGAAAPVSQAPVQVASLDPSDGMAQAYAQVPPPGGANAALVAAIQERQALSPMSAPQTVDPNPVPPQDPMAGLDPRTSPEARAALASGEFDGFAQGGGAQQIAQAMPQPAIPAAPSGAVGQVAGAVQQAAQARGVDPRTLIQIANNPRATDGQRRVAQALLSQQMEQQQAAQTRSYNERIKQEEWRRQDNRFAITDAREAETRKAWQKLDDNTLFNPVTGETKSIAPEGGAPTFSGSSVEAQSLNGLISSGAITKDQALQLGAGKTVSGPNGEILFMTPQGVFGQNAQGGASQPAAPPTPGAAPAPAPAQPGMIPLTEPKVTIDEKKAQTFADRMTTSGEIIDKMGTAGSGFVDKAASAALPFGLDSLVTSDEFKKIDQARRDFINAQLRRESGAVIGADEFDSANKQYFPQPGDTPDVLEQKRRNREIVIKGMQRDGGPTYQPPATTLAPAIEDLVKKYGG